MTQDIDYKCIDFQLIIDIAEERIQRPMHRSSRYADAYLKMINLLTWQTLQSSN